MSDRTKRILASAAGEAARTGSTEITPDHVLVGILACDEAPAHALNALGVDLPTARAALGAAVRTVPDPAPDMRPSAQTQLLIELAAVEAPDGDSRVEPEHVLLALTRDGSGSGLLSRMGITGEDVRAKLARPDGEH